MRHDLSKLLTPSVLRVAGVVLIAMPLLLLAACRDAIPEAPLTPDPDRPDDAEIVHLYHYRAIQEQAEAAIALLNAENEWCNRDRKVGELRAMLQEHDPETVTRSLYVEAEGDDLRAVELIADTVSRVRSVDFEQLPPIYLISRSDLRRTGCLYQAFEEHEASEADAQSNAVAAVDRLELLLGQQVAGYGSAEQQQLNATLYAGWYGDPHGVDDLRPDHGGVGEIVLVSRPMIPRQLIQTIAHELVHFLQDVLLGWQLNDLDDMAETTDQLEALRWVIEGDATLHERFAGLLSQSQSLSDIEWGPATHLEFDLARRAINLLNPLQQAAIYDAYEQGSQVLGELLVADGRSAINQLLYRPPISTEQLLHPDRLASEEQPIALRDLPQLQELAFPTDRWEPPVTDRMGEHYLRALIGSSTPRRLEVNDAATGWGSDQLAWWQSLDADSEAVTWQIVFDTPEDLAEGASALRTWFYSYSVNEAERTRRNVLSWDGPYGYARLISGAEAVWLIVANDQSVANRVANSVRSAEWTNYWPAESSSR